MLVEFLGLPGCGKSTLSRNVGELLVARGLRIDETTYDLDHRRPTLARQRAKLAFSASFAAHKPGTALADVLSILGTRQASLSDMIKVSVNWLYISSVAAARQASPVVTILDQGIAQAVWSIALSARRGAWVELLSPTRRRIAAAPDLVVRVRADLETIGKRLDARRERISRLDKLGRDRHALQRAEAICDVITTRLRAIGIPVLEIVNDEAADLAQGAHRVGDVITAALQRHELAPEAKQEWAMAIDAGATGRSSRFDPTSPRPFALRAPAAARCGTRASAADKGV